MRSLNNMTKRKFGILAMCLVACALAALAVAAQGKKSKGKGGNDVIVLKAQKTTARGTEADPNIKSDSAVNSPNAQMDAPEAKGGPKTRGAAGCKVEFDNRTRLLIKTFVDGKYRGTMDPFGDAYIYVQPGETSVYARADYDDGTYSYWGPKLYDCGASQLIRFRMEN